LGAGCSAPFIERRFVMIIASMIIKALPENIDEVVLKLNNIPNVTTYGVHKEENIIVLIEADSEDQIKDLARYINSEFDGILGTYPTFIGSDEDVEEVLTSVN
jgi:nitrate reductase NapAB chaperone NapD